MYLSQRPTRYEDFEACYHLIHSRFIFDRTKSKEDLRAFWRKIFSEGLPISAVIEDRDRPPEKRIVAHGCTLFVTEDFAQEVSTRLPAYSGYQLVRSWKAGKRCLLTAREIAQANTQGGLQALVLHFGWEKGVGEEKRELKLIETFFEHHAGWRLKNLLMEIYGPQELRRQELIGCKLLKDYREKPIRPKPPAGQEPFLVNISRDEKKSGPPPYSVAQLFNYTPPRFQFSPGEKQMLLHALKDLSDTEIAKSLHLSLWAVKKRWQAVYGKVGKRDPTLIKPELSGGPQDATDPWIRRRRLLEYLRHHLEELRPTHVPSRRGSAT